jgi:hypothetical protein
MDRSSLKKRVAGGTQKVEVLEIKASLAKQIIEARHEIRNFLKALDAFESNTFRSDRIGRII